MYNFRLFPVRFVFITCTDSLILLSCKPSAAHTSTLSPLKRVSTWEVSLNDLPLEETISLPSLYNSGSHPLSIISEPKWNFSEPFRIKKKGGNKICSRKRRLQSLCLMALCKTCRLYGRKKVLWAFSLIAFLHSSGYECSCYGHSVSAVTMLACRSLCWIAALVVRPRTDNSRTLSEGLMSSGS